MNGGVSSALNYGIKNCNGEYVTWLSHDDIYEKNNIKLQLKQLKGSEKLVSACKTGLIIDNQYIKYKETNEVIIYDKPLDHWKQWLYGCSLLIPKSIIISVGCLNEANKTTQDTELVWNILSKFKIKFLDTVCVYRRVHDEQAFQIDAVNNHSDAIYLLKKSLDENGIEFFLSKSYLNDFEKLKVYLYLAWQYQKERRNVNNQIPSYLLNECQDKINMFFNPCIFLSKYPYFFKQINWKYYDFKSRLSNLFKFLK
jgi:glycosyltransferase involved in cell wall biosynthesis